jgi:hypothetical protein|tara:strand:+ start:308 stop:487 length:180 start_codon:yes stop_codon:yes gene_type:complete
MANEISCLDCKHFNLGEWGTCKAYKNGIPFEIVSGELSHIEKLPNDNGIQFEPIEDTDA